MRTITFSDVPLTNYFNIEKVTRSILPPREVSLLEVPGRHGAYFTGSRYGVRKIDIQVSVIAESPTEYMDTIRTLAFCLDIDKPAELYISDEPNKIQYAILTNDSDMNNDMLTVGKGTLSFVCPDPFSYSLTPKIITPDADRMFTFQNDGTTATYPKFNVKFTQDANFVSFISPDGVILIGNPAEMDAIVLPKTQFVLNDTMTSTAGWANAPSSLDAGRVHAGTIGVRDGDGISATSYGTGTAGAKTWHGPAFRKDLSELVSDFEVQVIMNFSSQDKDSSLDGDQLGMIEIYMYDVNGLKLGKLSMRDPYNKYEFNIPEIYIGNTTFLEKQPAPPEGTTTSQKLYTTHTIKKGETLSGIAKQYKMTTADLAKLNNMKVTDTLTVGKKLKVYDKTVTNTVYPTHVGEYNDFYGRLIFSRIGDTFYAEIARYNLSKKKYENITKRTMYDRSKIYSRNKLAYIVVFIGQYDTYEPAGYMRVNDVKVIKHNTNQTIENPQIFQKGDELEVDLSDSSVRLNGSLFMNEVDVGSTFFSISEGTTQVKVNTDDVGATFEAEFTERYL